MRPHGITMKGVNGTGGVTPVSNSTMAELVLEWNVWETQAMVFLSFMLQFFLLATGSIRRRNTSGLLKALIWLAYVGADLVAVYALGLFSQYEDKYKLGRESFGDTLPFLWVPFLLVHLGGQDSITAFSLEDNNLWLRHLLNLATQGVLALYVFWKSFHRINYSILVPAMFVFVSGIIKYGERVWALKCASRNGLGKSAKSNSPPGQNNSEVYVYHSNESYALQTVLLARGLFVGRTVLQLGDKAQKKLEYDFERYEEREKRLNIVLMELGMMFDLLYTKANVLQRWVGIIFRCAAHMLMAVAFVLFVISEKHAHNRVNVAISYTLFIGAISMECTSFAMVASSPWKRAHLKEGSLCYGISSCLNSCLLSKVIQGNMMRWVSNPVGQFNLMDWSISEKSTAVTLMTKFVGALGMEQQWRNLWHIKHVEAKGILKHIVEWFDRPPQDRFIGFQFGRKLNYTLSLPFEHALYRLHIYTDLHLTRHFADGAASHEHDVRLLKEDCEKISNYMIYLMTKYPSMLPVSTAAEDVGPGLPVWVRNNCGHQTTKLEILEEYATGILTREQYSDCPFEPARQNEDDLRRSLKEIKEMWVRLLIYSAGKCAGELHARQLAKGGELLTFVWLLMVHHGLGDVATELSLLTSNDPLVPQLGSIVAVENSNWTARQQEPCYAFDFGGQQHSQQIQLARTVQQIVPQVLEAGHSVLQNTALISILIQQFLSDGEAQQDGATAARDDGAGTPSEIYASCDD